MLSWLYCPTAQAVQPHKMSYAAGELLCLTETESTRVHRRVGNDPHNESEDGVGVGTGVGGGRCADVLRASFVAPPLPQLGLAGVG